MRGLPQLPVDGRDQPLEVALHDVVLRAGLDRRHRRVVADRARDEDERHVGIALAQQFERRGPAEARHRIVGDREIPTLFLEGRHQGGAGLDPFGDDVVAGKRQRAHHERGVVFRVFDEEQAERYRHGRSGLRARQTLGEAIDRQGDERVQLEQPS